MIASRVAAAAYVAAWGGKWNIDMDYFIDRMGGSP
jgi:hypothetical protein